MCILRIMYTVLKLEKQHRVKLNYETCVLNHEVAKIPLYHGLSIQKL